MSHAKEQINTPLNSSFAESYSENSMQPAKKKRKTENNPNFVRAENSFDSPNPSTSVDIQANDLPGNSLEKQFKEALMYGNGENGYQKDYKKSTIILQSLSRQHFAPATFWLGIHFLTGVGGFTDRHRGLSMCQCAAAEAMKYFERELQNSAENQEKDKFALFGLALIHWYGMKPMKEDNEKAFSLFKEAGDQGLACALSSMGEIYEIGEGTEKNIVKAFNAFKRAAELTYPEAQAKLGLIYETGDWEFHGFRKDSDTAMRFYKLAADQENVDSLYNIAACHEYGSCGLQINLDLALKYYKKAADNGENDARVYLGYIYQKGKTVGKKDKNKTMHYYKLAARDSIPEACLGLANHYCSGKLISKKDYSKALLNLLAAQEDSDADADLRNMARDRTEVLMNNEAVELPSMFEEEPDEDDEVFGNFGDY